ncbi:Uncharacterised protein [BD1-7 clade bacterium]|uniref:SAM-dependent methyltransferase n=1 Tax=BD1-7 clade bacterium TaxID=2029982 RepID=A0A5S9NSD2_9GAMM|nr:Uncharacterised protein [BD1-7 clade bacterium]CAA0093448.1 Uncharacterised protein [BD1-7 clade bacterium]
MPKTTMKQHRFPPRIKAITQAGSGNYDCIWDTCCDHGQIGEGFLLSDLQHSEADHQTSSAHVYFVDQVAHICDQLRSRLEAQYSSASFSVLCQDAASISLQSSAMPALRHLVVIAGVYGHTAVDIMHSILTQNDASLQPNIDFLLCPNYELFELRQWLIKQGFSMKREEVVLQKTRLNEILLVSPISNKFDSAPSLTGKSWNLDCDIQRQHVQGLFKHRQRQARQNNDENAIIARDLYQKLLNQR